MAEVRCPRRCGCREIGHRQCREELFSTLISEETQGNDGYRNVGAQSERALQLRAGGESERGLIEIFRNLAIRGNRNGLIGTNTGARREMKCDVRRLGIRIGNSQSRIHRRIDLRIDPRRPEEWGCRHTRLGKQHGIRPAAKNRNACRRCVSGGGLNPRETDIKISPAVANNRGPAAIHNRERTRRQIRRRRSGRDGHAINIRKDIITVGKSVTIRSVACDIEPDSTQACIGGCSPIDRKRSHSVAGQRQSMFRKLNRARIAAARRN